MGSEEREDQVQDELNKIIPGFPERKKSSPPQGYFDAFPDRVLNQWKSHESKGVSGNLSWIQVISIAALMTGACIGAWWMFNQQTTNPIEAITSAEAYQYIHENIEEFEGLIEPFEVDPDMDHTGIPKEAIEDFLIEELQDENPEDLF